MFQFIPGLQLSEQFFHQAVAPVLERRFPHLRLAAGRFGQGSDVLGFDTPRSMDHDWGPQLALFLSETDYSPDLAAEIRLELRWYPHDVRPYLLVAQWRRIGQESHSWHNALGISEPLPVHVVIPASPVPGDSRRSILSGTPGAHH